MIYLWLLMAFNVLAAQPSHWSTLLEISDRHEFYQDSEPIIKPQNSWQSLFGFVYINKNLKLLKDCVYYRVPGIEKGRLKIKAVQSIEKCEDFVLEPGDKEYLDITALEFSESKNELTIDLNYSNLSTEKWVVEFQDQFSKPTATMNLSSAEFKASKLIFLAPVESSKNAPLIDFPKENSICHNINEDCEEVLASICQDCKDGWYEVPNGCIQGPKYCGKHKCGQKGEPACRRGMTWQKKEVYECRIDSSFAYCSKGFKVECDGKKAYCR